jgi:hypothetical protein
VESALRRFDPVVVGAAFVLLALAVYVGSNPTRHDFYDHFVWQAHAFLQGRTEIEWPVASGPFRNDHFQDVMPHPDRPGYGLLPFPPLPALVLVPFVAVFGLATNGAMVAAGLGALNVGLCWAALLRVTRRRTVAALATVFYAFGTVAWYAAMLGTTWFLAHVVASAFLFLAIRAALGRRANQPRLAAAEGEPPGPPGPHRRLHLRGVAAGILLGVAGTARLPVVLGAPFFFLVGRGPLVRRAVGVALGAAVPMGLLVAYNLLTTGQLLHPAYEHLYRVEYRPVPALVQPDWAIEDPRYIPQNAVIMLAWPPKTPLASEPACARRPAPAGLGLLLDRECPMIRPDPLGMSLILTSPAYLLALAALRSRRRRMVAGAGLAVAAIAIFDLMHFSQGWVQFGYRFSNDFAPFALLLVTLGMARLGVNAMTVGLVAASVAINAWGVYWGVALGW